MKRKAWGDGSVLEPALAYLPDPHSPLLRARFSLYPGRPGKQDGSPLISICLPLLVTTLAVLWR